MRASTEPLLPSKAATSAAAAFVCLVIWLNVFGTFNLPGRRNFDPGEVDSVA